MTAFLLSLLLLPACAADGYGILLLAHGGNDDWNKEIAAIGAQLAKQAPTEVALGMADSAEMQKAVSALEAKGVAKIVAVPLFINSSSEVMDQTRFVLGLRQKPSLILKEALSKAPHAGMKEHQHAFSERRVATAVPVVLTPALDDSAAVLEVLVDRARSLSRDILRETVIIVGHGPVDDKADAVWLKTMDALALEVKKRCGFRAGKAATIRDDSPAPVKTQAAKNLRLLVQQASQGGGRVIVVPYLIARGGVEEHIVSILKGLDYAWDGKTLCPHPAIARWASEVAAQGSIKDNMRRFQ
ncbi:MAG: hypothetical protein HY077_03575 [Elusimicrobia bacterium]|nr:hypothetical protein [Elusimicrobiota bacterium]